MQNRRSGADACPGAVDVHQAADGGLARVRLPGGRVTSAQLTALFAAAAELGSGGLELTSRGNVQIRGLGPGGPVELGRRLVDAGLMPSLAHEKVRNIMASPLGGHAPVAELDAAVCADPALAALPGRFLFAVDSGAGDVAWMNPDAAALPLGAGTAILLGGRDHGVRVAPGEAVSALVTAAREFLSVRENQWRVAELDSVAPLVSALGGDTGERVSGRAPERGPLGPVVADGTPAVAAGVPLGRLEPCGVVERAPWVAVTPWRGVVVPGATVDSLVEAGFLVDPDDPRAGVTACTGRPGCAKSLADVRSLAGTMPVGGRPVHFAGCARRCGRPAGDVVDVVAVADGLAVGGRVAPGAEAVGAAAVLRQERE